MLLKLLFWSFACLDLAGLLLVAVLAFAAAAPSHTSPLAVGGFLMLPAGLLALGVVVFTRATTPTWQWLALLLVAAPLVQMVVQRFAAGVAIAPYVLADGSGSRFRAGAEREVEQAIAGGDVDAALAALPRADVRQRGRDGCTLLELALLRLAKHARLPSLVAALLAAGAEVEVGGEFLPLEAAVGASRTAGIEVVQQLLAAGASPNTRGPHGGPAFFAACSAGVPVPVMQLLLERGADLAASDAQGRGVAGNAAMRANWPVLLFVLQRGADWRPFRSLQGQSLLDFVAGSEGWARDQPGYRESVEWLKKANGR